MRAPGPLAGLAAALLGCALAAPNASAATVDLADGGTLSVDVVQVDALRSDADLRGGAPAFALQARHADDVTGRTEAWLVPGSVRRQELDRPALARAPLSGHVFLVHAEATLAGHVVTASAWLGSAFSDPFALSPEGRDAREPAITFASEDEAIVAWRRDDGAVVVKDVALSTFGESALHSFVEVPDAAASLRLVAGPLELRDGVAHVVTDPLARTAYVFVADPDQPAVGVFGLRLDVLEDIWGGSAAPVPVTLAPLGAPAPLQADADDDPFAGSAPGERWTSHWRVDFTRARILDHEIYYWSEADGIRAVAFRNGEASRLLKLPAPSASALTDLAVLRAVWEEIGGGETDRGSRARRIRAAR